ncbi:hypothetical protein A2303_03030 [Candidatus Falkowbacteria bacterium RIFOXYB2_FULL_47_14]|uniref:Uncharacterized protein n=1 Tax=Candidatus Falkowbacteria bacterium RIFOXYA2_FULL_47_19 TaxID=1797994 RepID=A0A1F5SF04_9BACT|nr:MAG: hypothetical protein A2227_07940 [Candidatus Falkowbacteria bacterium RIFOXYA2_FULL_47_19]OGF36357.1 MAG: hypothetical protein A2468_01655 [Candidatus Falkowbacteria bacterium RIFOXYC2_FULL_46_15]OGF43330.1 MAG: hypothetical protein A2303_03030 [Candidatus Falkowbacteria bacterium RIFOXYB2_FULL_47_14]
MEKFEHIKNEPSENRADFERIMPEIAANKSSAAEYVKSLVSRYHGLAACFEEIVKDERPGNWGEFRGGLNAGEPYKISFDPKLFQGNFDRLGREIAAHEWGHAIYRYAKDMISFFRFHKIELPETLKAMDDFIESLSEPGFKNILKTPRKFFREFVSSEGERQADRRGGGKAEKLAELFLAAEAGGSKRIVEEYRNIFSENNLNRDYSECIDDAEVLEKWKKFISKRYGE